MRKQPKRKARNTSSGMMPLILIGAGVVLIFGVLIWQAVQSGGSPQAAAPANGQQIPEPTIQRVSLADAKAAFDGKEAVFLDVRDSGSYDAGHIPGAINIPLALLENQINQLDKNAWIITYCT